MKKVQLIILYLTVVLTTTAQTIGEAFYVYRNDGQFNAFFRDEVDSIAYSHYDADSLFYDEIVMQLVYTADSLYRIPLAAIDSVGFVQPETKYKEDAVPLIGNLFDYIISSDSLSLTFALSTPSSLLPAIGDKLVATDLSDKLPIGFTGTVRQVEQTDNGYVVSCDSLALEEVVEQFYGVVEIVGQQSDGNVQHYLRRRVNSEQTHPFRLVIPPVNQYIDLTPIVKPKNVYDINGKAVGNIAINPVITGKITRVVDNFLNISHYNIHAVTDVNTVTTIELAGEAINNDNPLNLSSPKTNFCIEGTKIGPYGIPIYYAFGPKFDISGEIALGTTVYADFTHTEDINYYPLTAAIGAVNPVLYPLANQFNTVRGTTKMTHFGIDWAYIAGRISARVAVCGRLGIGIAGKGHNLGWVGGEAQTGFKINAELGFDFEALSNAEKGTGFYDGVKDNAKVVVQPYWGLEGKISVLDDRYSFTFVGSDDYSFWGKKWEWDLLPKFSDTKATIISSSSAEVSANITNDCILPISVGFSLFDENGNRVGEPQWNDQKFRTRESFTLPYQTTFNDLTINKEYKAYPTLRLFGFNVLASPSVTTTLADQDAEAYCVLNDSTLTFYYDGNKNIREGAYINMSQMNSSNGAWREKVSKAVFDESFANYKPQFTSKWFFYCKNMKEIVNIEMLNTDDVKDMHYMFASCSSLTHLDVSHFNTANVTDMWLMFGYCSSLTHLDVSNFDTAKVTNMYGMFTSCNSLTNIDVGNFNTSNVTDMGYMFDRCNSLISLDVNSFNTSKVTNMEGIFKNCSSLKSLDLHKFNTNNVTSMIDMFKGCSSLVQLDLSHFDMSNLKNVSSMFRDCNSLSVLDIRCFNTGKDYSVNGIFTGCNSLTYINLSYGNYTSLMDILCELPEIHSVKSLKIDLSHFDATGAWGTGMFYGLQPGEGGSISLDLSHFYAAELTESIRFWGCDIADLDLSFFEGPNVTLLNSFDGNNITTINMKHFDVPNLTEIGGYRGQLFSRSTALKHVDMSEFYAPKLADMSDMFEDCSSLESVDMSNLYAPQLADMSHMFYGCTSLKSVDMSNLHIQNEFSTVYMFGGCVALNTVFGGNWNCSGHTMFDGCNNLVGGQGTKIGQNIYYYYIDGVKYQGSYYCSESSLAAHIDGGKDWPGLFTAK